MTPQEMVACPVCECMRCGHRWIAKSEQLPMRCANPQCRSPYWQNQDMVYVLAGYGKPEWFKIGATSNLKRRWQANRTRNQIAYQIPCDDKYRLEAAMHQLFAARRISNKEQFALTADDLKVIEQIQKSANPIDAIWDMLSDDQRSYLKWNQPKKESAQ